jgi:hypothetical protein
MQQRPHFARIDVNAMGRDDLLAATAALHMGLQACPARDACSPLQNVSAECMQRDIELLRDLRDARRISAAGVAHAVQWRAQSQGVPSSAG